MMNKNYEAWVDEVIQEALTGKGSRLLTIEQCESVFEVLKKLGDSVHSTEAFEYRSQDSQPLRIDLSIMGLDQEKDWEKHQNPVIANDLFFEKLSTAKKTGLDIRYIVWI